MQFTVTFFAVKGAELARQMREESGDVLAKVREYAEEHCDEPEDVEPIIAAAASLCRGEVPPEAPQEYFDAFLALCHVLAEPIELESFQFNNSSYLHDVGIWPWTQEEPPPCPVPRSVEELSPKVGFLSHDFMQRVVLPGLEGLPPCRQGGDLARREFGEVAESVVDDGLDLIAYYAVW